MKINLFILKVHKFGLKKNSQQKFLALAIGLPNSSDRIIKQKTERKKTKKEKNEPLRYFPIRHRIGDSLASIRKR